MERKYIECEICGELNAMYACKLCKRNVCIEHYDVDSGICVVCKECLCELCGKYLAVGSCTKCGRIVCEKCSKQIDPIRLICISCNAKEQ